jgi:hypothetical protein
MDELVKRLRSVDFTFWYKPFPFDMVNGEKIGDVPAFEIGKLCHEAAETIETLQQIIKKDRDNDKRQIQRMD